MRLLVELSCRLSPLAARFCFTLAFCGSTNCANSVSIIQDTDELELNSPLSTECLLQSLVADSREAIICFHLDGTVVLWNAAAEKLYGYSAEETVGKHVSLILPLYELPSINELLCNPISESANTAETVERLHKTGARITLQIQRSPVRNEAGIVIAVLEKASSSSADILAAAAEAQLRLLD